MREDIPSRLVTIEPYPAESFFVEINLKKVVVAHITQTRTTKKP